VPDPFAIIGPSVQQVTIYGVSFDMVGKQPIVLLKTMEGSRFLPIWIGHPEAAAILMKLQGSPTPRPMTHDLVSDMLGELNATVAKISVTELRENTFYAIITLQANGSEIEIDSRPSDALALAVRTDAPIFVADDVIAESAIEFGDGGPEEQDDLVDEFRQFLEDVSPDDFSGTS
jgi:bifunctional DNase/RNase